jgi:hypothetical protein
MNVHMQWSDLVWLVLLALAAFGCGYERGQQSERKRWEP